MLLVLAASLPRFYSDWTVFSTEALSARMGAGDKSAVPTILLAAGASLGATALVALAESNRPVLEEPGEERHQQHAGPNAEEAAHQPHE